METIKTIKRDLGNRKPQTGTPARRRKQKEKIIEAVKKGHTRNAAAALACINPRTVARWKEVDPVFAARYEEALDIGNGIIEKQVLEIAFDDSKDLNSARANLIMFATKKRMPEYRESAPVANFNTKVEFKAIDFKEVRKVLQEAGALEIIEGEVVAEDTDDPKSLPKPGEVRTP